MAGERGLPLKDFRGVDGFFHVGGARLRPGSGRNDAIHRNLWGGGAGRRAETRIQNR